MIRLHLASRSPRRRQLLQEAGIPFQLLDVDVEETVVGDPAPRAIAAALAEKKARAGAALVAKGVVLGSDTVVALDGRALGKPADRGHACEMLRDLAGSIHSVITGVSLVDAATGRALTETDETRVVMRGMTEAEITAYVASGESDDKAGGYAIQETGDRFVERIEGSYTNVVGLPMELLERMLCAWGESA
ncbi:MAG: septum formation protein Maf [Planctomycetes bacterium]|nr:septum formation protein Maf [Planctomycetota bacterium]